MPRLGTWEEKGRFFLIQENPLLNINLMVIAVVYCVAGECQVLGKNSHPYRSLVRSL